MKRHLLAISLCLATLGFSSVRAADDPHLAAVQAADDARVAAMKSPDRAKLTAIFADELRYSHASGAVDTKASFMDKLLSGQSKYVVLDYEERNFSFPSPTVALMTGRAHVKTESANGAVGIDATLAFLSVWKEEGGQWKFLAWQSCKMAPPKAPEPGK